MTNHIIRALLVCGFSLLLISCSHGSGGDGVSADPLVFPTLPGVLPPSSGEEDGVINDSNEEADCNDDAVRNSRPDLCGSDDTSDDGGTEGEGGGAATGGGVVPGGGGPVIPPAGGGGGAGLPGGGIPPGGGGGGGGGGGVREATEDPPPPPGAADDSGPRAASPDAMSRLDLGPAGTHHAVAMGDDIALVVKLEGNKRAAYRLINAEEDSPQTDWISFSTIEDTCPRGQKPTYTDVSTAMNARQDTAYVAFERECWLNNTARKSRNVLLVKLSDELLRQSEPIYLGMNRGEKSSPVVMSSGNDFAVAWINDFGDVPVYRVTLRGEGSADFLWTSQPPPRSTPVNYYEEVKKVYVKIFPEGREPIGPSVLRSYARLAVIPDPQYEPFGGGTLFRKETEWGLQGTGCGDGAFCVSFKRKLVDVSGRKSWSQELFIFATDAAQKGVEDGYPPRGSFYTPSLAPVVNRDEVFEIRLEHGDTDKVHFNIRQANLLRDSLTNTIQGSVRDDAGLTEHRGVAFYRNGVYHLWMNGQVGFVYYRLSNSDRSGSGVENRLLEVAGVQQLPSYPRDVRHAINQNGKVISIWKSGSALQALIGSPWTEPARFTLNRPFGRILSTQFGGTP